MDEIRYAESVNRRILAGLETGPPEGGDPANVTFLNDGQGVLNREAAKVAEYFRESDAFGGFAIHRHGAAYLSGQPGWPTTNPDWFASGR